MTPAFAKGLRLKAQREAGMDKCYFCGQQQDKEHPVKACCKGCREAVSIAEKDAEIKKLEDKLWDAHYERDMAWQDLKGRTSKRCFSFNCFDQYSLTDDACPTCRIVHKRRNP